MRLFSVHSFDIRFYGSFSPTSRISGFTKSVALEVASRGITANVVAPGYIQTDMTAAYLTRAADTLRRRSSEEQEKTASDDSGEQMPAAWMERVPMKRMGTPDDVANLTSFLASPLASYITGQCIHVNGGMY